MASCFILMSITAGNLGMITDTQITGNILQETSEHYVMDFSDEVMEKGLDESFRKKTVNKRDCVRVKNGN